VSDTLVIKLPVADTDPADWVVVDAAGAIVAGPGTALLSELGAEAESRRIIALAPATKVLRLNANIPLKGANRIRQALPFALEEQLAGEVEDQHFACAPKDDAGRIPVAVVEKKLLAGWLEQLAANGLTPSSVITESDALPFTPATITVFMDGSQVVIRDVSGELAVVDDSSMHAVLELLLDKHADALENDAAIVPLDLIVYCNADAHKKHQNLWERLRLRIENLDIKIAVDGAMPLLAGHVLDSKGINLLQGEFAPRTDFPIEWSAWRVAAGLLAAFLILMLGLKGGEYWQLSRTDAALDAAAAEVLATTFPSAAGAADPWGELRARLGSAEQDEIGPQAGFAEALEALAVAFAATPGIRMETLSYRSGEIDVQLLAPDVAALDQLRQKITEPGKFVAEIQSANPDNDVIKGRVQIMAAEGS
jgi:general secretion pathway protein L